MEQASGVATEVTSSIMRLKLEVEEKKRGISLLQTALVGEPAPPAWGAGTKDPPPLFLGASKHKIRACHLCPQPGVAVAGWRLPMCHGPSRC